MTKAKIHTGLIRDSAFRIKKSKIVVAFEP